MRKVACLAVFMALMMLVPVQAGENVSIQQSQPQDDNRQPSEENKTLYMFWNNSNTNAWTHFQSVDNSSLELYSEEVDNGLIDIDLRFGMEPILSKRLYMDPDGHSTSTLRAIGQTTTTETPHVDKTIATN
jgi:hypothetical protein